VDCCKDMTHAGGRDAQGKVGMVELAGFSSCRGLVTRSFVTVNSYMCLFDGNSDRDIPHPHRDSHPISKKSCNKQSWALLSSPGRNSMEKHLLMLFFWSLRA
jgi:hypothetical protein